MLYKTTTLSLLEAHPELYRRLRLSRKLLQEVDRYAQDLRTEYLELCQSLPEDAARDLALTTLEERIAQEAAQYAET